MTAREINIKNANYLIQEALWYASEHALVVDSHSPHFADFWYALNKGVRDDFSAGCNFKHYPSTVGAAVHEFILGLPNVDEVKGLTIGKPSSESWEEAIVELGDTSASWVVLYAYISHITSGVISAMEESLKRDSEFGKMFEDSSEIVIVD